MAGTAEVPLSLDDVQRVSDRVPFIADLAPSGKYFMEDLYNIGGTPSVLKLLVAAGLMNGDIPTVTGKTLKENLDPFPSLPQDQVIIRPLSNPIKATGHLQILRGNLAPGGAVAKITGKEGLAFTGKAKVGKIHASHFLSVLNTSRSLTKSTSSIRRSTKDRFHMVRT